MHNRILFGAILALLLSPGCSSLVSSNGATDSAAQNQRCSKDPILEQAAIEFSAQRGTGLLSTFGVKEQNLQVYADVKISETSQTKDTQIAITVSITHDKLAVAPKEYVAFVRELGCKEYTWIPLAELHWTEGSEERGGVFVGTQTQNANYKSNPPTFVVEVWKNIPKSWEDVKIGRKAKIVTVAPHRSKQLFFAQRDVLEAKETGKALVVVYDRVRHLQNNSQQHPNAPSTPHTRVRATLNLVEGSRHLQMHSPWMEDTGTLQWWPWPKPDATPLMFESLTLERKSIEDDRPNGVWGGATLQQKFSEAHITHEILSQNQEPPEPDWNIQTIWNETPKEAAIYPPLFNVQAALNNPVLESVDPAWDLAKSKYFPDGVTPSSLVVMQHLSGLKGWFKIRAKGFGDHNHGFVIEYIPMAGSQFHDVTITARRLGTNELAKTTRAKSKLLASNEYEPVVVYDSTFPAEDSESAAAFHVTITPTGRWSRLWCGKAELILTSLRWIENVVIDPSFEKLAAQDWRDPLYVRTPYPIDLQTQKEEEQGVESAITRVRVAVQANSEVLFTPWTFDTLRAPATLLLERQLYSPSGGEFFGRDFENLEPVEVQVQQMVSVTAMEGRSSETFYQLSVFQTTIFPAHEVGLSPYPLNPFAGYSFLGY